MRKKYYCWQSNRTVDSKQKPLGRTFRVVPVSETHSPIPQAAKRALSSVHGSDQISVGDATRTAFGEQAAARPYPFDQGSLGPGPPSLLQIFPS